MEFRSAYGSTPERFGALGYDVAMILKEVIDRSGRVSRRGLRTELLALRDFEGVSGLTSFDERGGSRMQLELLTVDSGMIRRLDELR